MELIHLPMPEEKVVVFKKDPEILLSDSTCLSQRVFVHLSFCSRLGGGRLAEGKEEWCN